MNSIIQDLRGPRDDVILEEDEEDDNFESPKQKPTYGKYNLDEEDDFKPKQKPTYEKYNLDEEDDFKPVNRPKPKIELPDIGKFFTFIIIIG